MPFECEEQYAKAAAFVSASSVNGQTTVQGSVDGDGQISGEVIINGQVVASLSNDVSTPDLVLPDPFENLAPIVAFQTPAPITTTPPPVAPDKEITSAPPSQAPAPSGPSPSPSYSEAPPEFQNLLNSHNVHRAAHHAPPLTWSSNLANTAHLHAQECRWGHSTNLQDLGAGENLYVSSSSSAIAETTPAWYGEIVKYDFSNPGFYEKTGHFTQLVWIGTQQVGCAMVQCPGTMMDWRGSAYYVVCQYTKPGNYVGADNFRNNVKPI